jgi:hypothetical protein
MRGDEGGGGAREWREGEGEGRGLVGAHDRAPANGQPFLAAAFPRRVRVVSTGGPTVNPRVRRWSLRPSVRVSAGGPTVRPRVRRWSLAPTGPCCDCCLSPTIFQHSTRGKARHTIEV